MEHERPSGGTPVPTVDVEDLRLLWNFQRTLPPRTAIGPGAGQQIAKQLFGDRKLDLQATEYRCAMLGLMQHVFENVWAGGEMSESAIRAVARMPMKMLGEGVQNGDRFVLEFLAEAARGKP